jgi:hypothetical protein
MDNILIYSATEDNFCIWQVAPLLSQYQGSRKRRPIRHGRCGREVHSTSLRV